MRIKELNLVDLQQNLAALCRYEGVQAVILGAGPLPYEPVEFAMQRAAKLFAQEGRTGNALLLVLEHEPVFTLGRRGFQGGSVPGRDVTESGIPVRATSRGGLVTYHGPGQLVAYPITHLGSRAGHLQDWISCLEYAMLDLCSRYNVSAQRREGLRGVFVDDAKIGSVGVQLSAGVSRYGLALNVHTDLRAYDWIVPCGLSGMPVARLQDYCAQVLDFRKLQRGMAYCLRDALDNFFSKE